MPIPGGRIDAILMDVMMPVMDGLEAARYIRWSNKENARDIPIIAMTANAFTEDRRRVLEAGMNEHLAKPLESEVLIKTIANYCGKVDHFKIIIQQIVKHCMKTVKNCE